MPGGAVEQPGDGEHLVVGEFDFGGAFGDEVGGEFVKPFEFDLPVELDLAVGLDGGGDDDGALAGAEVEVAGLLRGEEFAAVFVEEVGEGVEVGDDLVVGVFAPNVEPLALAVAALDEPGAVD